MIAQVCSQTRRPLLEGLHDVCVNSRGNEGWMMAKARTREKGSRNYRVWNTRIKLLLIHAQSMVREICKKKSGIRLHFLTVMSFDTFHQFRYFASGAFCITSFVLWIYYYTLLSLFVLFQSHYHALQTLSTLVRFMQSREPMASSEKFLNEFHDWQS